MANVCPQPLFGWSFAWSVLLDVLLLDCFVSCLVGSVVGLVGRLVDRKIGQYANPNIVMLSKLSLVKEVHSASLLVLQHAWRGC